MCSIRLALVLLICILGVHAPSQSIKSSSKHNKKYDSDKGEGESGYAEQNHTADETENSNTEYEYDVSSVRCIRRTAKSLSEKIVINIKSISKNEISGANLNLEEFENNPSEYSTPESVRKVLIESMNILKDNIVAIFSRVRLNGFVEKIKENISQYQTDISNCNLPGGDPLKNYIPQFLNAINEAYNAAVARGNNNNISTTSVAPTYPNAYGGSASRYPYGKNKHDSVDYRNPYGFSPSYVNSGNSIIRGFP